MVLRISFLFLFLISMLPLGLCSMCRTDRPSTSQCQHGHIYIFIWIYQWRHSKPPGFLFFLTTTIGTTQSYFPGYFSGIIISSLSYLIYSQESKMDKYCWFLSYRKVTPKLQEVRAYVWSYSINKWLSWKWSKRYHRCRCLHVTLLSHYFTFIFCSSGVLLKQQRLLSILGRFYPNNWLHNIHYIKRK